MEKQPTILLGGFEGEHNGARQRSLERLERSRAYEDLSTVCVCPTRGALYPRVVQSWMALMHPMNQKFFGPIFMERMEVAAAYNAAVALILENDQLRDFRYLLTIEEDNCPPPDGLLKLYETIEELDVVGGLYWTKGELGLPMIYGRPGQLPAFAPQNIAQDEFGNVVRCNGLGMGFTLFKMDLFREFEAPWFKTVQEWSPNQGGRAYTQDLYFFERAGQEGKRFGCDTRVLVGHYDSEEERIW